MRANVAKKKSEISRAITSKWAENQTNTDSQFHFSFCISRHVRRTNQDEDECKNEGEGVSS